MPNFTGNPITLPGNLQKTFKTTSTRVAEPCDFHAKCLAIREMLDNDKIGLVSALLDFMISSALVDIEIENRKSKGINDILKKWIKEINMSYNGQITPGLRTLAKEYFLERWCGSGFSVLNLAEWDNYDGYYLPSKMYFLDGSSVYGVPKNDKIITLTNYDYYLTSDLTYKLSGKENIILSKVNGRVFEQYPNPFLVKRGIYYNWQILKGLKKNQTSVLGRALPFLTIMKAGSVNPTKQDYIPDEALQEQQIRFQEMIRKLNDYESADVSGIISTGADSAIEYLIPELTKLFDPKLFEVAEKNILYGFGMIDLAEGVSSSRKDSILNPKAFISEITSGIEDFKSILYQVLYKVKQHDKNRFKYNNDEYDIITPKPNIFASDEYKNLLRRLYEEGLLSKRTTTEIVGEADFKTEVFRRKQEKQEGQDETMYPPIILNQEGNKEITEDKKNPVDKTDYIRGSEEK